MNITQEKVDLFLYITARHLRPEDQLKALQEAGLTIDEIVEIALSAEVG